MSQLFDSTENVSSSPPKRRKLYILPLTILVGFLGLFWLTSGQSLGEVVEVQYSRAQLGGVKSVHKEQVQFQAAGWLKAYPDPIYVSALTNGIVKTVHVITGDIVQKNQLLVELDDADAILKLKETKIELKKAEKSEYQQKIKIKLLESKLKELEIQIEEQRVKVKRAKVKKERFVQSQESLSVSVLEDADFDLAEEKLKLKTMLRQLKSHEVQCELTKQEQEILREVVNLNKVKVEKAGLDLERTKIYAPQAGRVQHVHSVVGKKHMLGSDNPKSTTVVDIYDPGELYVNVDVPIQDAFKIEKNQLATIKIDGYEKSVNGKVVHIAGEADIQKNTLAIRVKLIETNFKFRPDMLAQVAFLGTDSTDQKQSMQPIFIHSKSIVNSRVAVINDSMEIEWRDVQLGTAKRDQWIEVLVGVFAGEKIVVSPNVSLENGVKVRLGGEFEQ